jgi:hypothetical protein
MWKRILYFVFVLFAIEMGLFLAALPWSSFWERNILGSLFPSFRPVLLSNYFRGALTGLGLIDIWIGFSDLWNFRENLARLEKREQAARPAPAAGNAGQGEVAPPPPARKP